jgi:hypothetical protein
LVDGRSSWWISPFRIRECSSGWDCHWRAEDRAPWREGSTRRLGRKPKSYGICAFGVA